MAKQLRPLVVESWLRSAAAGVDADSSVAPLTAAPDEIADTRRAHPLARVVPLLADVVGRAAADSDAVMAVGDADGTLLWVSGAPAARRRAEAINFVEGSSWAERVAGTNAPGTALRLDAPVQIRRDEHFAHSVQRWTCVAAPIHDPATGRLLGVVDVTGGVEVAGPQTLALIRAGALLAEAELARLATRDRADRGRGAVGPAGSVLVPEAFAVPGERSGRARALGGNECVLTLGAEPARRLSLRHSEILVVLADHPDGVSGDRLAVEIHADDVGGSTMRAELARMRAVLGDVVRSRPYRLAVPLACDWLTVPALLAAGDVRGAVAAYPGPLLPASEAPGIVDRRDRLHAQLRAAVLRAGIPDLLVSWTRTPWGADDLPVWQHLARTLPASSPLRAAAAGESARLDGRLRA
ncbi:GAF domain-containing protein [Nakamurella leprariae]|uniref:GAF domain-containing protein n=1 Tax=Nakamurella leprariae TaxID=2803911 RepID=A0A938Y936_9ACTN|nr:GAF domain-containing protein [Nakamurella leprariae]MBM9466232.1 GAF domain-containing protein [Nakamurella leprariae]